MFTIRNSEHFKKVKYTKEFYTGIRDAWVARLFPFAWIARRIGFVATIFVLQNADLEFKLAILITSQIGYMFILGFSVPFINGKDFISEMSNEIFLLIGLSAPALLNDKHDWTSTMNSAYLGVLMISNIIFTGISISKAFI